MPGGRLIHLASHADTDRTALANVGAVAMVGVGDTLQLFAASGSEPGITQLTADLGPMGIVTEYPAGSITCNGTAGDDILIAGGGNNRLTGGAGADLFVFYPGREASNNMIGAIADYQPGVDHIDLSAFPMFHGVAQLRVLPRSWGARLILGDLALNVHSASGGRLEASDFGDADVANLDHVPVGNPADVALVLSEIAAGKETPLTPVIGGAQADRLLGGAGDDTIRAGAGDDTVYAARGNDIVYGGPGDDMLFGGPGADTLEGGPGLDIASYASSPAGIHADLLTTGTNSGDARGDIYRSIEGLRGSAKADDLRGDMGANMISGGSGPDFVMGRGGNDTLSGNLGNDRLAGNFGHDRLFGGLGNDHLFGGAGNDTLAGGPGNDFLFGGAGNDRLAAGAGGDRLDGGSGNDALYGAGGNDRLFGNAGNDRLFGGAGGDRLSGGIGNDSLCGADGNDRLFGDAGSDHLFGGTGADALAGGAGSDRLSGGIGNDALYGAGGNDRLLGNAGDDRLFGGAGNDVLNGGPGDDYLVGGGGADTFVFNGNDGSDTIHDFTLSQNDRLFLNVHETGGLRDPGKVLHHFASITEGGVLFALHDGTHVLLEGLHGTAALADHILITG